MGNRAFCQPEDRNEHSSPKFEVETANNSIEDIEN
jgi:hypothetical protein